MRAYPNNDKQMYLDRVRAHRAADELVRGVGYETNGKTRGCAVGCTLNAYDHSQYEPLLGVPEKIARLENWLFENLPENWLEWPEQFLEAIPVGADLSRVIPEWSIRMLTRRLGEIGEGTETWRIACREAVQQVIELHKFEKPTEAAESAAESAARSAARSAAESAARSAARSAAWSGAGLAEIRLMASDLLELLRAAE